MLFSESGNGDVSNQEILKVIIWLFYFTFNVFSAPRPIVNTHRQEVQLPQR